MGFLGTGWRRVFIIVLAAIVVIAVLFSLFGRSSDDTPNIPLSDVIDLARNGEVAEIKVRGDKLKITLSDGRELDSRKEGATSIVDTLERAGVEVGGQDGVVVDVTRGGSWIGLAISFLPLILFGGMLVFFLRAVARRRD